MTRRPIITEHALLRYLERVVGVDVDGHRAVLEAKLAQAVEVGAAALVSDGFRYCITDQHVVTVKPRGNDPLTHLIPGRRDD